MVIETHIYLNVLYTELNCLSEVTVETHNVLTTLGTIYQPQMTYFC